MRLAHLATAWRRGLRSPRRNAGLGHEKRNVQLLALVSISDGALRVYRGSESTWDNLGTIQRKPSKRGRGMTMRYLQLFRRRSRNRDERKIDLGDVVLIYDGQGTSNTNKVSVYLVSIIVVDVSSQ